MAGICKVLSLRYARVTEDEAIKKVLCEARARRAFAVFTPGATVAARAETDTRLLALLSRADLLLADGVGVSLAARLAGEGRIETVRGIELGERLLAYAAKEGLRVFFYGGKEGVAVRAAAAVRKKYPSISIRCASGYGKDPAPDILAFRPHLLFVCLGVPRQEAYIARNASRFSSACLGLGGSFDVWAGDARRAPCALRTAGLEWLWRTALDVRRVRRLLPLPVYFGKCAAAGVKKLLHKSQKKGQNTQAHGKILQN